MPRNANKDLSQILELESRRSSMMTMELLLTEQNSERADKNAEIQRLKVHSPPEHRPPHEFPHTTPSVCECVHEQANVRQWCKAVWGATDYKSAV